MTGRNRDYGRELAQGTRGGVLALVALFLPIAILCVGLVVDLGTIFFVRKTAQAACDLGALAGVQELDWDMLGAGKVALRPEDARSIAEDITRRNFGSLGSLAMDIRVKVTIDNPPVKTDPTVTVTTTYRVTVHFLSAIPGLEQGFEGRVSAEASVVKRTQW